MNLSRHATIRLSGPREQECGCRRSLRTLHVRRHPHTFSFRGLHSRFLQKLCHKSFAEKTVPILMQPVLPFALRLFYRWPFSVCRSFSVTIGALPALCFMQSLITIQSLFARNWWTRRDGVFSGIRAKKSPQLQLVGSIFLSECRTPLCSRRAAGSTSEQTSNSDYTH